MGRPRLIRVLRPFRPSDPSAAPEVRSIDVFLAVSPSIEAFSPFRPLRSARGLLYWRLLGRLALYRGLFALLTPSAAPEVCSIDASLVVLDVTEALPF